MKLEFQAFDKSGQEACGVLDAGSIAEATERLRQQELFVASVKPAVETGVAAAHRGLHLPQRRSTKLRNLAMFTRQLAALLHSGTPLAQGLGALERQARDARWRAVVQDLRVRLERGSSLADALKAHGDYFDGVYVHMVAAGESSGKLTILLDRLATLTRKRAHVLSMVWAALTYPIMLACVATGVMCIMLLFVVPRFAEMFANMGVPLPAMTAGLIATSEFLRQYWWAVLIGAVGGGVGLRFYLVSAAGRRAWDNLVVRLPQFGGIVRSFATARIARLLGLLMDSHLPIQEILRLTRSTTTNVCYSELLAKAEDAVAHGQPISSAFKNTPLISPSVYETIHSGEQSGQVGPLLLELADFLDDENEATLKSLTSIIEPILLVMMGAVVGLIAMSIFLPLFDVTEMVSPGGKH
jgi:type IV pilus assembly protein PilC